MSGKRGKKRTKAGTSREAAAVRRRLFVQAYIANGRNGTQAAITAGFAPAHARVTGAQLLAEPSVRAMVDELTAEHEKATGLTVENVLREVKRIALADGRKLYRADGTLKSPAEWDDDTAAIIASVETAEEYDGEGDDRKLFGFAKKVKTWDKPRAIDMAMRHLGLYEKDNRQRDPIKVEVELLG